jgi:subtilisin family serine protease/PKD repeat protein
MRKTTFKRIFCGIIFFSLLLSSLGMVEIKNLSAGGKFTSDFKGISDDPQPVELPEDESNFISLSPSNKHLFSQIDTPSQYPTNEIYDSLENDVLTYSKVEPDLLSSLKSKETQKVIITSTDMAQVRELLGYENQDHELEGKRHDLRLETSIFEVQSSMIPKIASLESTISIQSFYLPQPPQFPEDMGGEPEPTMWNAVKYHGAEEAWNLGFNGSGVKVAVLDTGVDFGHPDLNGTQARDENPSSPYYGWPLAFDSRSMLSYLESGGQGFTGSGGEDNWFSDTSATDTDSNGNGTLDTTGYNVSGIISQSGIYHLGKHPDTRLRVLYGNYVDVLVVDENFPGVYDTVYVNLDDDNNFTDEKACRKWNEVSSHDFNNDSIPDRSGGMIYFIADGINPIPYSDIIATENGYSLPIPADGTLVTFMINDPTESGGNHGTLCASAIAGQGVIASGRVKGTAPNTKIISVGNIYQGGNTLDSYYFAVEGYDGIPGTGDEANIVSCSFGDSEVIHGGWDFESRFIDNLTTNYAPDVTFAIASGNGGYGYGTVASPGSSPGVITVGAALNERITEVVYWSNRGPNALGQVDPDIVSVGVNAYGDQPLNQRTTPNGNSAYQTWSGTSLATPVTAGIIALIYDAYFQSNSKYPSSELAREILMSTADNVNYDPLVQGAGFSNATRATKVANNISGILLSPSFWSAGSYRGSDYDAFTQIMHPGETDNITISVSNADQNNDMNVYISDYILSNTEIYSKTIEANKSREDASSTRPDFFIPLNDSKNGISHIPKDTALLKVSGYMPWDEFDPDFDYTQENRFSITIYNWADNNGNGSYWNDTNGDGVAQQDEIEWGELSSICSSSITATTQEARMHDPLVRIDDGLIVGIFHYHSSSAPNITHIYIQSQCYNRSNWNWLDTDKTDIIIGAGEEATFNASITIPLSTPIGIYEGIIALNDTRNETAMPVIVNVASNSEKFTFGGNTLSTDLYANDQVYGAFRWGWRYEGGDWRFYFTDIPDSFAVNPGTKMVADVKWGNYPTDIDVFILGGILDSYSSEFPDRYGPYTLGITGRSYEAYWYGGKFRFNTTTGGPREIISADLSPGLNEVILHNVLYAGQSFSENVTGTIGTVNVTPYPWDLGFIDDVANLTGTQQFTLLSSFNLSGITAKAFGVYPPMEYPNELVYQNDPNDETTSNWSKEFDVSGAEYIRVNISSQYNIDIDLFLLRDINGNGIPNWGTEQITESTSPYAEEEIILNFPASGKYWVFVHGWNVPSNPSVFDCYIEVVHGNDINVMDIPVGSIMAGETAYFNASYSLPPIGGEYRGIIVIGLTGLGDTIRVPFRAEIEGERPTISNLQPVDDAWVNDNQPMISAQYNDSGSGIDISRVFIYIDGMNHTGDAIITSGSINLIPISPLSEGLHIVYLIVSDMFSNQNSTTWQFFIDSQKPIIFDLQPLDMSWVNFAQPIISAQYIDLGSGINTSRVFILLNGVNQTINATINSGSIIFTPTFPLSEGSHMVYLEVWDLFESQNSTTWQFSIDTIAPSISLISPMNNSIIPGGSILDFSVIDTNLMQVNYSINGGFDILLSTPFDISTIGWPDDDYTILINAIDLAGNLNSQWFFFTLDSTKPTIILNTPQNNTVISPGTILDFSIFDSSPVQVNYSVNGEPYVPFSSPFDISTSGWLDDNYIIQITALDLVSNSNFSWFSFIIDSANPVIFNIQPSNGSWINSSLPTISAQYNGSGSEIDLSNVFIYIDGMNQTVNATITTGSIIFNPTSPLSEGNHTVYLIVTDMAGNQNSTTWQFFIDNKNPNVEAGPDKVADEDEIVNFDGSLCSDENGLYNLTWNFGDGHFGYGMNPSHSYSKSGTYIVTLTVWDKVNNSASDILTVHVNNVMPNAVAGNGQIIDEGETAFFDGSASYDTPSDMSTLIYTWYFDDGAILSGVTVSHVFGDNGVYNVTLVVQDDNGYTDSDNLNVTVNNVAPTAYAGGPYQGNEGIPLTFTGSATDPGNDSFTYEWDFNDSDGLTYSDAIGQNPSSIWPDDFSGTIYLRVTDDDGGVGTASATVIINNIAPTVHTGGPYTGNEGSSVTLTGSATDPGIDTFIFKWDLDNDGFYDDAIGINPSWTWIDNGAYVIRLRVTDDDGGVGFDSTTVIINNVAPTANANGPYAGNESTLIMFAGSQTDPGNDNFTYLWDFGDGNMSTQQNPSHIYADDGVYTVTLTIIDDDGGVGNDSTIAIVYNRPPIIEEIEVPIEAKEDHLFILKINATDAEGDRITFTDNTELFEIDPISGLIEFTPINDDVGINEATINVSDDDGASSTIILIINIVNENDPPILEEIDPQIAVEDQTYSLTIVASDLDVDDILTFSDDTELFDIDQSTGTISFIPTNDQVGTYLVSITVQDAEGEKDTETFTLTILNTNDPPVLSDIPDQHAKVGQMFTYTATASDIDDTNLLFSDDSELFVIDPITGAISFIPEKGDEGLHIITITVTDSHGDQDSQTMNLEIEGLPDEEPEPEIDWFFLIPLILIIILIWPFLLYILMRRKREREEQEPGIIEKEAETEQLPLFPEVEEAFPPPPDFEEPPPPPPPYSKK